MSGGVQTNPRAFFLDDVVCTGSEWSPNFCTHNGRFTHDCSNGEMYRVYCNTESPTPAPIPAVTNPPSPAPMTTTPAPTQIPPDRCCTAQMLRNHEFMLYSTEDGFLQAFNHIGPNNAYVRTYAIFEVRMIRGYEYQFDTCGSPGVTRLELFALRGTAAYRVPNAQLDTGECRSASRLTYIAPTEMQPGTTLILYLVVQVTNHLSATFQMATTRQQHQPRRPIDSVLP